MEIKRARFGCWWLFVLAATSPGCADGEGGDGECIYAGDRHAPGAQFLASDGCNTCTCQENGAVVCGAQPCVAQCLHDGRSYRVGDTFYDALRCNRCSCTTSGTVCTERACNETLACSLGEARFASGNSVVCEDGCNLCMCSNQRWTRTERACPPLPKVELCESLPDSSPSAHALYLRGDALALEIDLVGCEANHPSLKLCWDGAIAESSPVQMSLRVVPTETTACDARVTEQRVFDLSPLRDAYRSAYQTASGTISLQLEQDSVLYSF